MEEFFSSFLRRAGMPASAGLSCLNLAYIGLPVYPQILPQSAHPSVDLSVGDIRYKNCGQMVGDNGHNGQQPIDKKHHRCFEWYHR